MRVTYKNHPDDLKNMAFFSDRALKLLDAAGAQKKWAIEPQESAASVYLIRVADQFRFATAERTPRAYISSGRLEFVPAQILTSWLK